MNAKLPNTWIHDFGDFKMLLDYADNDLSRQVKYAGSYRDEILETNVIKQHVKKDMIVADLGANLGFYSVLSASLVGVHGHVYAFEPFAHNANLIRESVILNQFNNVTVIEKALSDKPGESLLYLSPYYSSEHSLGDYHYTTGINSTQKTIPISLTTLDDYFESVVGGKNIDFIKMDIEGSEGKAIRGMKNILTENQNLILMTEFWPDGLEASGVNPIQYLDDLIGFGFKLFHVDGQKQDVYSVSIDDIADMMKRGANMGAEKSKEITLGNWYTTILCKK